MTCIFFPYKECKRATITVVIVQFVLQLEDLSFRGARVIVVRRAEGSAVHVNFASLSARFFLQQRRRVIFYFRRRYCETTSTIIILFAF